MSAWSSSTRRSISSALARSLGVKAERAKTVHEATDLLGAGAQGRRPDADRRRHSTARSSRCEFGPA